MRPVKDAGHARIDRAERADVIGGIDVVGRHLGAERALHDVAIVFQRAIRQYVAEEPLPHVTVRIDEARHDDAVRRIDHLGVRRADVRLHRRDLPAFDQHVGLLEVADDVVERENAAALDQDRPAGLCRLGRRLRLTACGCGHERHRRDARGGGAKELPARQTVCQQTAWATGIEQMCHFSLPLKRFRCGHAMPPAIRNLAT